MHQLLIEIFRCELKKWSQMNTHTWSPLNVTRKKSVVFTGRSGYGILNKYCIHWLIVHNKIYNMHEF